MAMTETSTAHPKIAPNGPRCLTRPKLDPGVATTVKEH
jgi:hypothetical protein